MIAITCVVDQHAQQSALLWLRRDRAVTEPHYTMADMAKLDGRLDAHLDGLRIAGQEGWAAAERELGWLEAGEVFTGAVLAIKSGMTLRVDRVVALGTSSYELSRALVSALGWLPFDEAAVYIRRFLATNSTALRRIGIAAAAVHRHDPGQPLVNAVDAADGSLRARAIRAVGELGRADLLPVLKSSFDAGDDQVRFAAAWSIARLADDAGATEILRTIVENGTTGHERALPLALGKMEVSQAVKWIRHLNENPRLVRTAIRGAGLLGLPDLVPWLIDIIPVAQLARLAGEAFCMITGIQLALDGLEGRRPAGFESGPTDDPKDHNVAMDADENLFWPDQNKVAAWWRANSHRFEPGTRYFVGKPMTIDWLNHVLRHGYQRQRAAAALELAIRQPGTPLFEVRAPGFRQQELLR